MEIELKNISFGYQKNKKVIHDLSLKLNDGLYLLVGPNGAGKSTLLNLLMGLLKIQEGTLLYDGKNMEEDWDNYLTKVGYSPQYPKFYLNYKLSDFMEYMCRIRGCFDGKSEENIASILKYVNLYDKRFQKIKTLSGGMKQRLGIAQALLGDTKFIVLDEPTAGLDPLERKRFRCLVKDIAKKRMVLVATHLIYDVEGDCNILMMKEGSILHNRKLDDLLKEYQVDTLENVYELCYGEQKE